MNGEMRVVRGEYGKAAEINVNGKISSLDTAITYGDNITVIPAQNGKDVFVKASELVSEYRKGIVRLNGNAVDISTIIYINGRQADKDEQVNDGDQVQISRIKTLKDLLEAGGLDYMQYDVFVNESSDYNINDVLKDGDIVICANKREAPAAAIAETNLDRQPAQLPEPSTVLPAAPLTVPTAVTASEQPANSYNEQARNTDVQVTVNGQVIVLKDNRAQYIFVDVFNYINFDLTRPQGNIVLKLNIRQAAFTDIIQSGDVIEIYWNR